MSGLLLGVDGGNTKTVAVVVDRGGAVLGAGGADCGDIHNAGSPEPALVEIVRAATAALDAAFGRFGAEEVVALTVIENAPSWGLMRRLGMRRREELDYVDPRFGEELNPSIIYSIDREAWESRA